MTKLTFDKLKSVFETQFDDFLFIERREDESSKEQKYHFIDKELHSGAKFIRLNRIKVSINKLINLFYDTGENFTDLVDRTLSKEQAIIKAFPYPPGETLYEAQFHPCGKNRILLGLKQISNQTIDVNTQLEEELTKMVKLFRDAQRIAHLGYWEFDLLTKKLWGTRECRKILELDPAVPMMSVPEISAKLPETARQQLRSKIINSTDPTFSVNFEFISQNGKLKQLTVEGDVDYNDRKERTRVFGVLRDITGRKDRDDQLNRKLQIEKAISRISFGFIAAEDRTDALEKALKETATAGGADRACLLLMDGKSPGELIQWNNEDAPPLFFTADRKKVLNQLHKCASAIQEPQLLVSSLKELKNPELRNFFKKQKTHSLAVNRFSRNGETAFYLFLETLQEEKQWNNEDNYLTNIAAYLINNHIVEKAYEKALIESETKYKDLFDQMSNGFAIFTPQTSSKGNVTDLKVFEHNGALEQILDQPQHTLSGKSVKSLFPSLPKEWTKPFTRILKNGEPQQLNYEFDDIDRYLELSIFITREKRIAAIFKDLTQQKKLEKDLKQAEKLQVVGQLAGGIAHDFNNQLMGIMGYASMLESMIDDEEQLEYLRLIMNSAKRSSEMTRKLLDFSRKGKIMSIPINLNDLVSETVTMLRHSVDKKIKIRKYLRADTPMVKGDPSQIQNALLNIGINACDAMSTGGNLTIYTRFVELSADDVAQLSYPIAPGHYVQIRFLDTGDGMSDETRTKIFEPFFTTKPNNKGTGMGLAAVFGAVKEHKGGIGVKSELGFGTIFDIYLKDDQSLKPLDLNPIEELDSQAPGEGTILVLDDEEVLLFMLERILRGEGYDVKGFSNPDKAIQYYSQNHRSIDLVMLDFIMPGKNGTEVFAEMKRKNSKIKALLLSGYSPDFQIQKLISKGILGFIQKPVDKSRLVKRVKAAIK